MIKTKPMALSLLNPQLLQILINDHTRTANRKVGCIFVRVCGGPTHPTSLHPRLRYPTYSTQPTHPTLPPCTLPHLTPPIPLGPTPPSYPTPEFPPHPTRSYPTPAHPDQSHFYHLTPETLPHPIPTLPMTYVRSTEEKNMNCGLQTAICRLLMPEQCVSTFTSALNESQCTCRVTMLHRNRVATGHVHWDSLMGATTSSLNAETTTTGDLRIQLSHRFSLSCRHNAYVSCIIF